MLSNLTLQSSLSKETYEILQRKKFTLSNENMKELNEPELLELLYFGFLAKSSYECNDLLFAKEYYLHFLDYFDDETFKIEKNWLKWELQNKREIKIATTLKSREICKKYKGVSIAELEEWVKIEKDEIIEILKEWLLCFIIYAVQDLYMIDLELKMQEMASKAPNNTPVEPSPVRMSTSGPVLSEQGKILRPFRLVGKNYKNVFGPSHNLPTMTIDEYIEEEIKRGGIKLDKQDTAIDLKALELALDEDQDWDAIEAQRQKDISWDEFKDNNPRGHGNRIGKG
eukprot:NODE_26_length_40862_cov_0.679513.p18 type:complete len:284 gc:universal NODE_26_length_40862_cov_0.679513:6903-6052(-)